MIIRSLARQSADQPLQVAARERDTAGSGSKARPRDMDENRATAARDAWPRVVVDLNDQVIKSVGTPKAVAWFIGRPPEPPIVASVLGILAPGVVDRDRPDR